MLKLPFHWWLNGPRQANLVLIAYASSEPYAARSYKQWVKRNLQTESQIPGPSEWLGMRIKLCLTGLKCSCHDSHNFVSMERFICAMLVIWVLYDFALFVSNGGSIHLILMTELNCSRAFIWEIVWIFFLNRQPILNLQTCSMFPLAFVAVSLQGHRWGFISRNYVVWPIFFLMNYFIALFYF